MHKQRRTNVAEIILRFLRRAKSRWSRSNLERRLWWSQCSIFEQRSHSCEIAKKNSIRIERGIKLSRYRYSARKWRPREQQRPGTDPIPFHFTVFRDTVRRDKAMRCCTDYADDSTFASLKLIRETGINFAASCKLQIKGASIPPSRSRLNHNSSGILFREPLSVGRDDGNGIVLRI